MNTGQDCSVELQELAPQAVPCGCACLGRTGEVRYYKHKVARDYLFLDADGNCYRRTAGGFIPSDWEQEIASIEAL